MTKVLKMAAATVALTLGSALPVLAQIDNGMTFTTAFPFYAGNTKMPTGSYRIAQTDIDTDELLIQSADDKYSTYVGFVPMSDHTRERSMISSSSTIG
jgi:hypothetical protein